MTLVQERKTQRSFMEPPCIWRGLNRSICATVCQLRVVITSSWTVNDPLPNKRTTLRLASATFLFTDLRVNEEGCARQTKRRELVRSKRIVKTKKRTVNQSTLIKSPLFSIIRNIILECLNPFEKGNRNYRLQHLNRIRI